MSRNKHVLVVEDDHTQRAVFERILQSIDPEVEVDWVTTAEEGIFLLKRAAADHWPDYCLALADIYLDGWRTGLDLWQVGQDVCPEVPFVMVSSLPADTFYRLLSDGAILPPYLQKPFRPEEGRNMLRPFLEA